MNWSRWQGCMVRQGWPNPTIPGWPGTMPIPWSTPLSAHASAARPVSAMQWPTNFCGSHGSFTGSATRIIRTAPDPLQNAGKMKAAACRVNHEVQAAGIEPQRARRRQKYAQTRQRDERAYDERHDRELRGRVSEPPPKKWGPQPGPPFFWWRRRESNPRPQVLRPEVYMLIPPLISSRTTRQAGTIRDQLRKGFNGSGPEHALAAVLCG